MKPPTFYGSKFDKDPQEFFHVVYKVLYAMGVTSNEKAELAWYQLKDVAQIWYVQWRDNRSLRGGLVTLEIFKATFLDGFFPRERREEKVTKFINLRQGGKSVHEVIFGIHKFFQVCSFFRLQS